MVADIVKGEMSRYWFQKKIREIIKATKNNNCSIRVGTTGSLEKDVKTLVRMR